MLQQKVKDKSKGELTIDLLGGPEVIPSLDQGSAIRRGVVDMGHVFSAAYSGLVPVGLTLPLSRLTPQEERQVGYYDFLKGEYAKAGLLFLGRGAVMDGPFNFNIIVKKKITRPQELAGMKIGGISPQTNAFLREIGAVPVLLPSGEIYVALDTGVIDGHWDATNTFAALKEYELKPYLIDHGFYQNNMTFIMNPESFNKLPQHLQKILLDSQLELEKEVPVKYAQTIAESRKKCLDGGMTAVTFSPADVQWYIDAAYRAGWDEQVKLNPTLATKAKELLEKPR